MVCSAQQYNENPPSTTPTLKPAAIELAVTIESLARNRPEEALHLAEEAIAELANSPDPNAHGRIFNGAAYALYFLGRYDQSMQRAKEAERLAQAHQLSDVLARSYMLQGNVLQSIGEYTRALKQYREAANYYQSVGNIQYLGYCYNNMGNTYRAAGRYEAALDLYQQYREISNSASVNKGIGETYLNLGEIGQALEYFRDAYSLYEEDNDQLGMALAINSQANAYILDEKPDKALRLFERAINLAQQNNQQYSLEYSFRGKAKALLKLGNLDDAMIWIMQAYDMANERRETSAIIANLETKSEIYQAKDDIYQALQAYQHIRKLEQAYKAERDSTQLAVMQALFESESKAAEIAALEKRNTLLSLEKEIEKEQTQYARLASGVLIAALLLLMYWAWSIYRDRRRLAHLYAELGHAKIQAEQAAKTKSVFLANMSHEIRTPLTSIIGYAEGILQGDVDKEAQQRVIQIISENGNHLLHVINDILDFTKIEANKLEFEALSTPLFQLLAQVESVAGKRARDKGLSFDLNYHFPLPEQIISDPTRLRQILFNLTSNALKFTQKGSIIVDVTAQDQQLKIAV
ncbi:MAG: tetratricopeptide repeat protein [Aestuariibacter sp.]